MDPEILRELDESLKELEQTLKAQSADLVKFNAALKKSGNAVDNNTTATNEAGKAASSVAQSTSKYGQTVSEVDAELQKQNKQFGMVARATGTAALDFGKALVSADTSLTKYGSSASQLGGQAWEVGKNFGLLGKVVGGALAGLGLAANSILTLNQNIISFRDDFTKQSGVLPITTEKLGSLAKEAGFAYNRMPMLAKTVTNLGSSLLSLGGYAGEGAVRFMSIANVGEEQRKRFSRMGLQQEDLLEYQSYYVELQGASGQSQNNKRKTDQQIQRESLLYSENLLVLSGLTGEKASTIKDRQKEQQLKMEEVSATLAENAEMKRLRELNTDEGRAKAKEIEENQKLRKETIDKLSGLGYEAEAFAAGSVMRLGSYTDATGKYTNLGLLQQTKALKQNKDITGFTEKFIGSAAAQNEKMNTNIQYTLEAGDSMGALGRESAHNFNKIGNDLAESTKKQKELLAAKGEKGGDSLADSAASIQEVEILASQKFQSFLETIDPLRHGLELFKNAAIIAAAAIGGGALIAGVAKVISGRFGELGSPGNPMHAKVVSGPEAKTDGIGSKLKNIFKKTAAPTAAAAGVGAAGTGAAAAGAAAATPLAKAGTGATALSGAAGSSGGSKVGMFLMGLSKGLSTLGKAAPQVLLGAGAISGAIAIIGAGIAGATWIIGKSLPSLATGLTAFNTVNGDKLSKIGTGMAGLGVGLLAIGGSNISTAMGNLAKWATGDDSNPVDNLGKELIKFQNMNVDPDKVEQNSKAFISFNEMVAKSTEINGTVAGALSRAFASFFEVEIPLDKFKNFSDIVINPEQVEKNATAFKLFSEAMGSYKGYGNLNALGIITKALGGSIFSFFQSLPSDDPIKRFEDFSKIPINGNQIKTNATAFKDFANAMAEYRGGPGVLDALSQLAGGAMMTLFNVDGPIDAFKKFAQEDFGPNMEKNADAFTKYANASTKVSNSSNSSPSGGSPSGGSPSGGSPSGEDSADTPSASSSAQDQQTGQVATPSSSSSGPAPLIGSGKDAILNYAKSLSPSERVEFYRNLASQGMQRAAAARQAGNSEQAALFEKAASSYTLASSIAESSAQTTSAGGTWQTSGQGYVYPVPEGSDTSAYGNRTHPVKGGTRFHTGLDIGKGRGSPIIAAADGKITRTSYDTSPYKGFGQIAIQDHGDGLQSVYAHLDKYNVREGDSVGKGKQIGTMGSTGMSTGPHLHYILQKAGGFAVPSKANTIDPKSKITERPKARAEKGGIFTGFDSVFTEGVAEAQKIGTLDPSSLIAKMGKTTVEEVTATTKEVTSTLDSDLTPELMSMIESKLEKVLSALENNQSTHERILKNSM